MKSLNIGAKQIAILFNLSSLNIIFENERELQAHIEQIKIGTTLNALDFIIINEIINLNN
jgi:hypothetical protein